MTGCLAIYVNDGIIKQFQGVVVEWKGLLIASKYYFYQIISTDGDIAGSFAQKHR
jgi:hypothetical protein